ncbi:hypothetical protein ABIA35_009094 [Catenulispora sp. MAP12-49]
MPWNWTINACSGVATTGLWMKTTTVPHRVNSSTSNTWWA